jgi:hypothetical protein
MDYSNNSNNLHFAFDQQESEVSDHKATSSTESGLKTIAHLAISQIVMKNFIKFCLIIKECPEEILMKLAIVLKISKSS